VRGASARVNAQRDSRGNIFVNSEKLLPDYLAPPCDLQVAGGADAPPPERGKFEKIFAKIKLTNIIYEKKL